MHKQIEELRDADLDHVTGGAQLVGPTDGQHLNDAVTGQADRTSSSLAKSCATGQHFKEAKLTVR
jgi:hypothetical protein